eukprot:GHVR01191278.1.p1 GENE.GHVR01191278.1~~GHVR01191278.1.p1  ORF type:complete len:402 (+),score=122.61 GHVR01191278.1:79-1284(+)
MQDRMGELRAMTGLSPNIDNKDNQLYQQKTVSTNNLDTPLRGGSSNPFRTSLAGSPEIDDDMDAFFSLVDGHKAAIEVLEEKSRQVQQLKTQLQQATTTESEKSISKTMSSLISTVGSSSIKLKKKLELLDSSNAEFEQTYSTLRPAEVRIRAALHGTLLKRFRHAVNDFQAAQLDYKKEEESKVTRTIKLVYPEASDNDVRDLISSGGAENALVSRICKGQNFQDAVLDLEEKCSGMKNLEQSVKEIHELFQQLALLVEGQGELLDHIEHQVSSAQDYVEQGRIELVEAKVQQKNYRKKKFILALIVFVVLILLACYVCNTLGFGKAQIPSFIDTSSVYTPTDIHTPYKHTRTHGIHTHTHTDGGGVLSPNTEFSRRLNTHTHTHTHTPRTYRLRGRVMS